jgi:hypothetical protein
LEQLRLSVAGFFYSGSGSLVGEDDDVILDCYRLARWYHQSPDVFLAMTLSEVRRHMTHTLKLAHLMRAESADGD